MNQVKKRNAWERAAALRRILILCAILASTFVATSYMAGILPHRGASYLEMAMIAVFAALFGWVSIGFWEALSGLLILARGYDRYAITRTAKEGSPIAGETRTAILVPIANEEVGRVTAGLAATYKSLERTGRLEGFDFYILSDTSDPDKWVEEEIAWAELCRSLGSFNRIFYRNRRVNLKRKSGNIADFCKRWGKNYRYMAVLDADSVMAGPTLVRMVEIMEGSPQVGILQTSPSAVNRETPIGRAQQFANHAYGPMFTAGLHFMQLGDSHFWGHNALIRVEPFMKYCGLPKLPGKPPRGGFILSHDFVEAAFMRRSGFEVWLAYDLPGSYEEVPPTLLEELKRDRRWCQGNLQHIRLLFTRGLFSAHRALFLHGAMSYVSALLWFLFLSLSSVEAIAEAFRMPVYFPGGRSLFPEWPVWHPRWAMVLLSTTALLLFLPKVMSVLVITFKRGTRYFGGFRRMTLSVAAEVLFSMLFAPIRMLFHSKFVFFTLLGRQVSWSAQQRADLGTGWTEALRFHWPGMFLAVAWGGALFLYNRSFFWWNTPIIIPLLLSGPLSIWSSRAGAGRTLRKMGLFVITEEVDVPAELTDLAIAMKKNDELKRSSILGEKPGFVRGVVDPTANALHRALLRKERKVSLSIEQRRSELREKALVRGPDALSGKEKRELLYDPEQMEKLHREVWEISDPELAQKWGIPPLKEAGVSSEQ
jgi:membrane glycosyltransferase